MKFIVILSALSNKRLKALFCSKVWDSRGGVGVNGFSVEGDVVVGDVGERVMLLRVMLLRG